MRRSNGGKEHESLHHSIEWPSVLSRSLATSVKGLSLKALLHTYMIATHVQDCYYNNIYKPAGICPYTESTNTFKIKHSST